MGALQKLSIDAAALVEAGIIPPGTPDVHIKLFAAVCERTGLDPSRKQIHLMVHRTKSGNRYSYITGIDGYRSIAERTGAYAGNDDYRFDEGITEYEMLKLGRKVPKTATATVYKIIGGQRCPFTATARWEEYYPGDEKGFMYKKMPFLMLGKCAESLAFRKAFPEPLAGLYTQEEIGAMESIADVKPDADEKDDEIIINLKEEINALNPEAKSFVNQGKAVITKYEAKGVDVNYIKSLLNERYMEGRGK